MGRYLAGIRDQVFLPAHRTVSGYRYTSVSGCCAMKSVTRCVRRSPRRGTTRYQHRRRARTNASKSAKVATPAAASRATSLASKQPASVCALRWPRQDSPPCASAPPPAGRAGTNCARPCERVRATSPADRSRRTTRRARARCRTHRDRSSRGTRRASALRRPPCPRQRPRARRAARLPVFRRSRCAASTSRAPRGNRQRVAQRRERATCDAHVGAGQTVVRVQRRLVKALEIRAIQREVSGRQAQQRARIGRVRTSSRSRLCGPGGLCVEPPHQLGQVIEIVGTEIRSIDDGFEPAFKVSLVIGHQFRTRHLNLVSNLIGELAC